MECLQTVRGLSRYLDGKATADERRFIEGHLVDCGSCSDALSDYRQIRGAMRSLPLRAPSQHLATNLKIIASRERSRRLTRVTFAQKWTSFHDHCVLTLNNMMKPLALPVCGGFLSACALFGMLVPDFAMTVRRGANDVPAPQIYTEASLDARMLDNDRLNSLLLPIAIHETEIVLDVHLDDQGRMTQYNVVSGHNPLRNESVRRRLESTLLVTTFNPATTFGQPISGGRIRVRLVHNEIDVRG